MSWGHHGGGGGHHGGGGHGGGGHHGGGHGGGHGMSSHLTSNIQSVFGQHGGGHNQKQYAGYHQAGQIPNTMVSSGYQQTSAPYTQGQAAPYQQPGQVASVPYQQAGRPVYQQQQQAPMQYQPGQAGPHMGNRPPPQGIDPTLWGWFQTVDRSNSGNITSNELQQALLNNNWSHFNGETCRLMVGMFDKDKSGTIDIHEFAALWKYIQEWKTCFNRFDTDRSGTIDQQELNQAFASFGYRLSPQFSNLCVRIFDKHNVNTMKFDDFIQCCVMLKTLTDAFRKFDTNQTGVINVSYEQFMDMVLNNTLSGI